MWLKLKNGNYHLLESDLSLVVDGGDVKGYRVGIQRSNVFPPVATVQDGYATREDAQAALDELMDNSDLEYSIVQPPVQPEELAAE